MYSAAEEEAKNDETKAVFSKHKEKKEQSELLQQAIDKNNYDVAIILIFRGATLEGSDTLQTLAEISRNAQMLDDDFVRALVSGGLDLAGIAYGKLIELCNVALIRENIENHLIQNIEVTEESRNTPLHAVAVTNNEKLLKLLLNNGASSTQFLKNKRGQIPLEISKRNKYMFRIILIDFLNYALKSPKFSSNKFQKQLGGIGGLKLFCLKRDFDGNKTLLEFLNEQGMIKEREELIQLLIKIDQFRYQGAEEKKNSKRRIIKILRAGIKPSRGLKESIDSVQEKYSWESGKILSKRSISVAYNLLWGWSLYAFDVGSDLNFYISLGGQNHSSNNTTTNNTTTQNTNIEAARIVTLFHIILPFLFSLIFLFTLLKNELVTCNWYLPLKIPLPPLSKLYKTIIEWRFFGNNKDIEDSDYEKRNTDLLEQAPPGHGSD